MAKLESNQRRVMGMDGKERIYTYEPLTVAAAADVEDDLLRVMTVVIQGLGDSALSLFSQVDKSKGLQPEDIGSCMGIPAAVLRAVPKDDLKGFAKVFLSGAVVDETGGKIHQLENGWTDEYYRGKWLERMDAIIMAIDVSFPGYFGQALAYLTGFAAIRLGLTISKAKKDASVTA